VFESVRLSAAPASKMPLAVDDVRLGLGGRSQREYGEMVGDGG